MRTLPLIMLLFLSTAAAAQVTDPLANFPAEAITEVRQPEVPGSPPNPDQPPVPASPKAPQQPIGPISEAWPVDTVKHFVIPCTQGNIQLIGPCRCVIQSLMKSMTHREFMEISQRNAIDKDIRYTAARQQCALKTQAQKKS